MAVNPVAFHGMIQNTHDLSSNKTQADQRPVIQQDQAALTVQQDARASTQQVGNTQQSAQDTFDPSEGGDGTGYEGNKNKKKKNEGKDKKPIKDGIVTQKNSRMSFDASI